jgi:hypothetical protein
MMMPVSFLLATAQPELRKQGAYAYHPLLSAITEAFGAGTIVEEVGTHAQDVLRSPAMRSAGPEDILLLDARLPEGAGLPPDEDGTSALRLLQALRERGMPRPALVLTRRVMAMPEVDDYCTPSNQAMALPLDRVEAPILAGFVGMLRQSKTPAWDVIEINVKRNAASCSIGAHGKTPIKWGSTPLLKYSSVLRFATDYARQPDFSPGWARRIHTDGGQLFHDLVLQALGPGLFLHLEQAAGGLEKLAFRFWVDDPQLHTAPFEATVRLSGQPPTGNDNDFSQDPFVLINAPITRRTQGVLLRVAAAAERVPRPARLLFIRSQIGEHPAGETDSATVGVPEVDRITGRILRRHFVFEKLENIESEWESLKKLESDYPTAVEVVLLDLSKECATGGAEMVVKQWLEEKPYDVVHFAGHSLTTPDALTWLVLPGETPGEAEGMAVQDFADSAAKSGARLVYLSSCRGSSANTVGSLGQRGVPHVLGFRWDVEDDRAAEFAKLFYAGLFGSGRTICEAFRTACRGVYQPKELEASPIWASPILTCQPDDWMAQRVLF